MLGEIRIRISVALQISQKDSTIFTKVQKKVFFFNVIVSKLIFFCAWCSEEN